MASTLCKYDLFVLSEAMVRRVRRGNISSELIMCGGGVRRILLRGCVISICCVGFASLDVVCDELYDCAVNLSVYQLSDQCEYAYRVETFAHIECYSDCLCRGNHLVEPLCYGIV